MLKVKKQLLFEIDILNVFKHATVIKDVLNTHFFHLNNFTYYNVLNINVTQFT